MSRRQLLEASGTGLLGIGAAALLGACSSTSSAPTTSASSVPTTSQGPKTGGNLRIGLLGGGASDTLDPNHAYTNTDIARAQQLFDPLTTYDATGALQLKLASEFKANADATLWTIRVPAGITFHDGKPLTADDLVFTFQNIMNAKDPGTISAALPGIDVSGIRKLDNLTIQVPFSTPYSGFPDVMAAYYAYVVPEGFNPKTPVGTGPFKYQSFRPGVESVFSKNADYWQHGVPYVDQITIVDFADETSEVNGLQSNQIDGCSISDATLISAIRSNGGEVVVSQSGASIPIYMNCSVAPFNDVRVRQAVRLLVNRPQVNDVVFSGNGLLGNDVLCRFDPEYDSSLPQRQQDIPRAKALLAAAGHADGLSLQLVGGDVAPGAVSQLTVFAQQAGNAGVKVSLDTVSTDVIYGPNYTHWKFSVDYVYQQAYLAFAALALAPGAPDKETHFTDATWSSTYAAAQRTVDVDRRRALVNDLCEIDYDDGGYIVPVFLPQMDAHSGKVQGVVHSRLGIPFNCFDFKSLWLS